MARGHGGAVEEHDELTIVVEPEEIGRGLLTQAVPFAPIEIDEYLHVRLLTLVPQAVTVVGRVTIARMVLCTRHVGSPTSMRATRLASAVSSACPSNLASP